MTRDPKKIVTAADLMARLNADPQFVAKSERIEAERDALAAEWRRAEASIVGELRAAGFEVDSVWDLVNRSSPYPDAVPILVDHLQRPYPARVREGIARALAVPEAKFAWTLLTRMYREEEPGDVKDGLAAAIAAIADDALLEEVISLAHDRGHGTSRGPLLRALERSGSPRATTALIQLEADPVLANEIAAIRGRIKRPG